MNILVIGNGFDLAHGLPTKYGDFLEWVKVIKQVVKVKCGETFKDVEWGNVNNKIKELIIDRSIYGNKGIFSYEKICNELLNENIWIDYFLQCDMYQKENWIDFESEISRVIQTIDEDMHGLSNVYKIEDKFERLSNGFLHTAFNDLNMNYKNLRDRLLSDLNKLIQALEIYLCEYVEKIDCKKISPDIKDIMAYPFEYADKSTKNKISKVLNFNYTSTYEHIYFKNLEKLIENVDKADIDYIDYVHGEADINHTIESNNMVLGIDEYLPDDRKDKDLEFIAFKKFYQRIYKGTGCKYKEWVNEIQLDYQGSKEAEENCNEMIKYAIKENNDEMLKHWLKVAADNREREIYNVYIFGHSLDVTDKDILRDLILNDNVYTTIYYHKKDNDNGGDDNGRKDLGIKIANLVKVIGQDELIRRTGGRTKTIEFKLQQDMVERV